MRGAVLHLSSLDSGTAGFGGEVDANGMHRMKGIRGSL